MKVELRKLERSRTDRQTDRRQSVSQSVQTWLYTLVPRERPLASRLALIHGAETFNPSLFSQQPSVTSTATTYTTAASVSAAV